ncbi:hypothetical protein ACFYOT_40130 [Saccharothrix saharensis]|uniref:hypothetical protein n=1 Tax=Saccharothrix saharensis TaxID=571190 RepID=UPI0036894E60
MREAFDVTLPLLPWKVYSTILRELEADDDEVDACRQSYRHLAEHFEQRNALPPHIAALTGRSLFMAELGSLRKRTGMSLRDLSVRMREQDPKNNWGRSTLGRYLPDIGAEDAPLPMHGQRLRVLLTVLCGDVGRPGDVEHLMRAWQRLRTMPGHQVHLRVAPSAASRPLESRDPANPMGALIPAPSSTRSAMSAVAVSAALLSLALVIVIVMLG